MNILVTGANGFLGSRVVEKLKKSHKITALLRKGHISGVQNALYSSYNDPLVENAVKKTEVIVHIAGQLHGPWKEMHDANVMFTKRLVELAQRHKIKQFIYISSENVSQGNSDIYSRTKALAEKEVMRFKKHLILRPTVIYGPNDNKYVTRLASIIKKYPLVPVLGNGKNKFQFVYVDDVVSIIEHGIERKITGTYVVAGPESITYDAFMEELMKTMRTQKPLVHLPLWLLTPIAHILNLLFKTPPLTPSQLENLKKNRTYNIDNLVKIFKYKPTPLKKGLKQLIIRN